MAFQRWIFLSLLVYPSVCVCLYIYMIEIPAHKWRVILNVSVWDKSHVLGFVKRWGLVILWPVSNAQLPMCDNKWMNQQFWMNDWCLDNCAGIPPNFFKGFGSSHKGKMSQTLHTIDCIILLGILTVCVNHCGHLWVLGSSSITVSSTWSYNCIIWIYCYLWTT